MSNEKNYGANDSGDLRALETMADSYQRTVDSYAGRLPEIEASKLYHAGLALYFAAARDLLDSARQSSSNYANLRNVLAAAQEYHLEKAGLAGIVMELEHEQRGQYLTDKLAKDSPVKTAYAPDADSKFAKEKNDLYDTPMRC